MKVYAIRQVGTNRYAVPKSHYSDRLDESESFRLYHRKGNATACIPRIALRNHIEREELEVAEFDLVPSKTLAHLQRCTDYLGYLEAAGVDNWPGMEHVSDLAREAGYYDEEDE
jgi:hypothetical protein